MATKATGGSQPPAPEACLAGRRDELLAGLLGALRATMFSNRHELRPGHFQRIAAEEADALLAFLSRPEPGAAEQRGARLCRDGLGAAALLGLARAAREALSGAPEPPRVVCLELLERYHAAIMSGFMAARAAIILEEQERIRSAVQATVSRYAIQMAVAADIARAATSILDLDELLQTAVELIRSRFGMRYVAIFLVDADQRWADLQTSAGEVGSAVLRQRYRLKVGGDSLVGRCIAQGEAHVALDVGEKAGGVDAPPLAEVHSEMVAPLIARGSVIGAMALQSRVVGAFSDQNSAAIRITADQLANAIANARLFRERERQIAELSALNELSRLSAAAHTLETLLQTVCQQLERIYAASQIAIATCRPADRSWCLVYSYRDGSPLPLSGEQHTGGLIGHLAASRRALLLSNLRSQERFARLGIAEPPGPEALSWMGVPLIAADDVVGVITVASTAQEGRYAERDLTFLATIAAQVATAMVNTRLYEQLRQELHERGLRAEELREARDAAQEASRAKSQFLANMSHELRTPLTAIIGYSELLQFEARRSGYVALIPDLAKVNTAGSHLLAIINDILDVSRIESGKVQLSLESFDVGVLLDELSVTAAPLVKKNRNLLLVQAHGALGTLRSDATRVRQIVLNLLSNAAKFTTDGQIILAARRSRGDGGDRISISVADTGIGIERAQIGRLFEDFTQADTSMTRRYGGTGLGLALSRRLCHMLGGTIDVVSEPGRGSIFTVHIPSLASERPLPPGPTHRQ